MDKIKSNTYLDDHKLKTYSYGSPSKSVIRKGGGFEHRKVEAASSRLVGLAAKLIKGQSVDLRGAETDSVVRYTRKVMRVAGRGNARARQRVSTMLRDNVATRVLFETIVPKLTENTPYDFEVYQAKTISRAPSRTTLRLVFDVANAPGRSTRKTSSPPTGIRTGPAQNQDVLSKSSGVRLEKEPEGIGAPYSADIGQRSLATVEGPVGTVELRRIGARLRIPVRASINTDHWTLGLRSLSADKSAPLLLRVVRRPNDLDGLDIELAWRGKGPSEDLVAELLSAVEELRVELADEASGVKIT